MKWLKTANGYFEDIVLPKLDDNQKAMYKQIADIAHPALERLDRATGTMLIPALKDGQSAFVLDAKMESKQIHQQLPAWDKAMPIPEPAIVLGVSDAALLRKAFSEYRAIANDLIADVRKLMPNIPEFQVPDPQTQKVKSGTLYYYPLPPDLGLDKQIVPNAGLADHVAVASLSLAHSERLLAATALKVNNGPLADLDKPRGTGRVLRLCGPRHKGQSLDRVRHPHGRAKPGRRAGCQESRRNSQSSPHRAGDSQVLAWLFQLHLLRGQGLGDP